MVAIATLWPDNELRANETRITKLKLNPNTPEVFADQLVANNDAPAEPNPVAEEVEPIDQPTPNDQIPFETYRIASGDSLSKVFSRVGLTQKTLHKLLTETVHANILKRIKPEQELSFKISDDLELLELRYQIDELTQLQFTREGPVFKSQKIVATPDVRHAFRQGRIEGSLFVAGTRAGLSHELTMELANIFGYDIDFLLDIRKGDEFSVVYEELFLDNRKIGNGRILAAEFTNKGTTYAAVYFDNKQGQSGYYTPQGDSMRKAFLRSPLDVARISSHFNLKRKHPILNRIRAHKGTDYAAARGTPIRATGDGKVQFKGRKGGWGNTVILTHGQKYKTLYAHMSKYGKGIKNGTRVKQGQIIGYVGSTGLATGPHLHYEFHENGVVRNPVTVKFPNAKDVAPNNRVAFKQQTQQHLQALAQFKTNLASL